MNRFCSLRRIVPVAALLVLAHALPVAADEQVPFKGYANGAITGIELVGNVLHLTGSATGEATHLGLYTREERVAIDAGAIEGSLVFTAANGDRLCAAIRGGFISANTAVGTYT